MPPLLQQTVLEELYYTHIGVSKIKQRTRRYVYWPSIHRDIEKFVRSCSACALVKKSPPRVTINPWAKQDTPVEAKSKWIEVGVCTSTLSSY